jgi:hypothetical protein
MSISFDKEKKKEKERIAVNQLSMKSRKRMLLARIKATSCLVLESSPIY